MRHLLVTLCSVLLTFAALAQPPESGGSWPAFRGPAGDGRLDAGLPGGEGQVGFDLTWKRPLGSGYSGISIADGRLVTLMAAGERDVVLALDASSGEELWRFDLAPAYAGHDGSHDGPISTPAIADGRVFALSPWGRFVALDLQDGAEVWSVHLKDDLGIDPPFYGYGGSPGVAGGTVALQADGEEGTVIGFDAATGEVRWRALPGGEIGAQSAVPTTLAGKEQFAVLSSARVNGLDPADGAVLWEVPLEGDSGAKGAFSQSPMPIGGDRLLVKHKTEVSEVIQIARDGSDFSAELVRESRGLANSYSPPAVGGREHLYGYTSLFLSAMDPASGDLLWRSREPGDGFLIAVEDHLAVLTKTGSLHLGKASPEGWRGGAEIDLFEDLAWTPPSFADGAVFVRSLGELARVDLVRRERVSTGGRAVDPPAMLQPLLVQLAEAEDPGRAYETFLGERELPLVDGETVTFLWHGEAEDVAIAGDMIGMRREEPMHRAAGTDLWWWTTRLPLQARIRYVLYVNYEPITDPRQPRTTPSTLLGPDMNWNRGEPMPMSWFAMSQWPGLEKAADASQGPAKGRLETIELTVQPPTPDDGEAPEPVQVPVQVWLPTGYDASTDRYPVAYIHHRAAMDLGGWRETLDREVGKSVAPLIAVMPQPPRMRGFGALFVEQIVPQIDGQYRTIADREGRANVGMGWNSQAAATLTFGNPDVFGKLAMQSVFMLETGTERFEGTVGEATAATVPLDIYLEWGRWDLDSPHEEMDLRASSKRIWDFLRDRGWQPAGGEVWDSTDFGSWSQRTDLLLQTLFPLQVEAARLAAWQTGR
ncbi:MAG: PQQ-binding-like beta-propeller repeat protein [Acidobacteriota bacterium]